jgi:large subunit ribosomal protein L5
MEKKEEKVKDPKVNAPAQAPKAQPPKANNAPKADNAPKKKDKDAAQFGKRANESRMRDYYKKTVVPQLMKEFAFKNINEVPRLEKITLNMRLGDIKENSKSVNAAMDELKIICGQKPVPTKARKSLANWKIREGMVIGAKVTLRGGRMYDFYDKLISIAFPRVRDFRGVSPKAFDGRGNYATGIKEQLIFPEISYDQVEKVRGFDICIITSAKTDEHAKALLKAMGMPFKAN